MSSPVLPTKVTRKPRKSPRQSLSALIIIALLSLFVVVSALPRYVSSWPWSTPLKVANQSSLQAIRAQGIELRGWITDDHISTKLGGDTWSMQQLSAETDGPFSSASPSTVALLLRPQVWEKDQPEVEWLDLKGAQGWQTDSSQALPFTVELPIAKTTSTQETSAQSASNSEDLPQNRQTIRINTDFFRAWSKEQTYAVLQWYASPLGGSPSPAWWFWTDQKVQWSARQRLPWVAVSIWLPIDPLSDISVHRELAVALGQSVQTELLQTIFPETMTMSTEKTSITDSSNSKAELSASEVSQLPDALLPHRFPLRPLSPKDHASFLGT